MQVACSAPKLSNLPDLKKRCYLSDEGGVSINYSNSNSMILVTGDSAIGPNPVEREREACYKSWFDQVIRGKKTHILLDRRGQVGA